MEAQGLTTGEEFRLAMFADWLTLSVSQPMDVTVTVNGGPSSPGSILAPHTPMQTKANYGLHSGPGGIPGLLCGRDEEPRPHLHQGDCSVTFTDGESAYLVTRDGKAEVLALDVPTKSHGPWRAPATSPPRPGGGSGRAVEWKGPFRTAAVTTHGRNAEMKKTDFPY